MAEAAEKRPSEKALYGRAEAWRPYRGVAAHLLWAYYGAVRRGEITPAESRA
jgi:DNA-3-methyladenine glycosylase II